MRPAPSNGSVDNDGRILVCLRSRRAILASGTAGRGSDILLFQKDRRYSPCARRSGGAVFEAGAQEVFVKFLEALNDGHGTRKLRLTYPITPSTRPSHWRRVAEAGLKIIVDLNLRKASCSMRFLPVRTFRRAFQVVIHKDGKNPRRS